MRILIIGGVGFIGFYLVDRFMEEGINEVLFFFLINVGDFN